MVTSGYLYVPTKQRPAAFVIHTNRFKRGHPFDRVAPVSFSCPPPLVDLGLKLTLQRGCPMHTSPATIMESPDILPIPAGSGAEGGVPTSNEPPFSTWDRAAGSGGSLPPRPFSDDSAQRHVEMCSPFARTTIQTPTSVTDATIGGHPKQVDDVAALERSV